MKPKSRSVDCASLRRNEDRACFATAKAGKTMHRCDGATAAPEHAESTSDCKDTTEHSHMHRDDESRADCASRRREQRRTRTLQDDAPPHCSGAAAPPPRHARLLKAVPSTRGPPPPPRSADYASLRQSNGSGRACIATAGARQTLHRYGSATAATYHASRRREQRRLCMNTTEQPT